jgi:methionine sulfoxide reductase heme-binding subunit
MTSVAAVPAPQDLWFVSRGSGLVLLVLLSVVMVLGAATRAGWASRHGPRFVVAELHRTLSLFGIALLALHVLTAILDRYVSIGWAATVIPFLSPYRRLAIGLGTVAADVGAAVLLTSVLRSRLGFRAWRAVHWLAYLGWPAAVVHTMTAGNDMHTGWVAVLVLGCAAAVTTAMFACLVTARHRPRAAASPAEFPRPAAGAGRDLRAPAGPGARQ